MAGMIYEMYGSTADRAPSAADMNSGKGLVRGLFCLVRKDASEKARKQESMHSYGFFFWQLPPSRGGEVRGPLPPPGLALAPGSQAFDRLLVRTVPGETARCSRRDPPWSISNSPPTSLSGLLCSNIMSRERAPGHPLWPRENVRLRATPWDEAFPSDADPWPRRSFRRHQLKHAKRSACQCVKSMLPPSPGRWIRLRATITTQQCLEKNPARAYVGSSSCGSAAEPLPSSFLPPAPRPCRIVKCSAVRNKNQGIVSERMWSYWGESPFPVLATYLPVMRVQQVFYRQ